MKVGMKNLTKMSLALVGGLLFTLPVWIGHFANPSWAQDDPVYRVNQHLERVLKDPNSARVDWSSLQENSDGSLTVRINAKNSFGAYTGSREIVIPRY